MTDESPGRDKVSPNGPRRQRQLNPPPKMVRDFLGRPYSFQAYAELAEREMKDGRWSLALVVGQNQKRPATDPHGFTRIEKQKEA